MNIFHLDESPTLAARAHCDKHVNKMAFEGAQMLSTACFKLLPHRIVHPAEHLLYAPTHVNHPSTTMPPKQFIILLEKIELCVRRASSRFEKGTREYDTLQILAHEMMKMQREVKNESEQCVKE